jgi:hypothetical protein
MFELIMTLLEEKADRNMILLMLHYSGYDADDAQAIVCAAGLGRERTKLSKWARERFRQQRGEIKIKYGKKM